MAQRSRPERRPRQSGRKKEKGSSRTRSPRRIGGASSINKLMDKTEKEDFKKYKKWESKHKDNIEKTYEPSFLEGILQDRYKLFMVVVLFSMATFFISGAIRILSIASIFLLLIFLNDKKYSFMERKDFSKYDTHIGFSIMAFVLVMMVIGLIVKTSIFNGHFGVFYYMATLLGICIIFWGIKGLKQLALPYSSGLAMIFIDWVIGTQFFIDTLGPPFVYSSAKITGWFLHFFGYALRTSGDTIMLSSGDAVCIYIWCSGINGVLLFTIIMIYVISQMKMAPVTKLLVIVIGAVGQYYVNIIRLIMLIIIAENFGLEIMDIFHSGLGDFLFVIYFGIVYYIVLRSEEKQNKTVAVPLG